jgi:spermidine/putrescine transport system substrate-binding protein
LGTAAGIGPWFVRDALSSSGELNWFTWDDYEPKPFVEQFTKDTGIKLNMQIFTGNEEALNKMRSSRGVGIDLVTPGLAWVSAGVDFDLYQPIDIKRVKNYGNIQPDLAGRADRLGARRDGKIYAVPFTWSTESLALHNSVPGAALGTSYGILWNPQYAGKVTARARTLLLATSLWMEGEGKMEPGSMQRAFGNEELMKKVYGQALGHAIANKKQIHQFWLKGAEQKAAFLQNGCTVGMAWDSILYGLINEKNPFKFFAPKEGALTVMDTHALSKAAKNTAQAYAFMDWSLQAKIGGLMTNHVGYNSVVTGANQFYGDAYKAFYAAAYPGDADSRLFIQGTEHPWFIAERQRMVDRLMAA